jgi:hypothetical protein
MSGDGSLVHVCELTTDQRREIIGRGMGAVPSLCNGLPALDAASKMLCDRAIVGFTRCQGQLTNREVIGDSHD